MRPAPRHRRSPRSPRLPTAALGALVATLLAGGVATAEDSAGELWRRGRQLFADGSFAASLRVLGRARDRAPRARPRLRAQIHLFIGFNHAAENRLGRARAAFRAALSLDAGLRIDARRHKPLLVKLFRDVRRSLLGELQVTATGRDAVVLIDGRRAGKVPYRARLLRGVHRLALQTAGEIAYRKSVDVQAGKTTRIHVVLRAARPAPTPPPGDDSRRGRRRLWTWVALGGAVAAAATAIGVGISARADHGAACDLLADASRDCGERSRLADPAARPRYDELRDRVATKALVTNIAWAGAGALAVTAAVLFWLEGRGSPERKRAVAVGPRLGRGAGLVLRWRY